MTQTFITNDSGISWNNLIYNAETIHLHSFSSLNLGIKPILTSKYGTFIANGNIGSYLSVTDITTFYSDNGAKNITLIANQSSIYEFANHGYDYLIALSDRNNIASTNTNIDTKIKSLYNTNYNYKEYDFIIQDAINIKKFSINNNQQKHICEEDDFEIWSLDSKCINGEYTRLHKKRNYSTCLIPDNYDSFFKEPKTRCICAEQDFECDQGFTKKDNSCVSINPRYYDPPFICNELYIIFNGVIKANGNNCKLAEYQLNYDKSVYVCPHFISIGGMSIFQIIAIIIISIFLTALLCLVKNFSNNKKGYIKTLQTVYIIKNRILNLKLLNLFKL